MAIKARFYIHSLTRYCYGTDRPGYANPAPIGEVVLKPVTRPTDDNVDWASSTPSGEIKLTVRGSGLDAFEKLLGKDVAITFEEITD